MPERIACRQVSENSRTFPPLKKGGQGGFLFSTSPLSTTTRYIFSITTSVSTTAELALTFAAARRIGEAERYLRAGNWQRWLPRLFLGTQLRRKTVNEWFFIVFVRAGSGSGTPFSPGPRGT